MLIKYILRLNKRYKLFDEFKSLSISQKISIGFFSCVVLFYSSYYWAIHGSIIIPDYNSPHYGIVESIFQVFFGLFALVLLPIIAISFVLALAEIYYRASSIKNIHPFFKWTIFPFSSMVPVVPILYDICGIATGRNESTSIDIYIPGLFFLMLAMPLNLSIAIALLMVADERKHKTYYPPHPSYISQKFPAYNFKNYSSIFCAVVWIFILGILTMVWIFLYPVTWATSPLDMPVTLGVLGILTFVIRFLNPKTSLWPLIWLYPILFFYFDFIMNFYQGADKENLQGFLFGSTVTAPAVCAGIVYAFAWGADTLNKHLLDKNT